VLMLHCIYALYHNRDTVDWTRWCHKSLLRGAPRLSLALGPATRPCIGSHICLGRPCANDVTQIHRDFGQLPPSGEAFAPLRRSKREDSSLIDLVIGLLGITSSFVLGIGVGGGGRGALDPWILKIITKKRLFFQFRGVKNNFTIFGPSWKKFCENPLLPPPLEKILPTPMVLGRLWGLLFVLANFLSLPRAVAFIEWVFVLWLEHMELAHFSKPFSNHFLRFTSVGWLFCHTLKPLVIFVQLICLKRQSRLW